MQREPVDLTQERARRRKSRRPSDGEFMAKFRYLPANQQMNIWNIVRMMLGETVSPEDMEEACKD